MDESEIPIDIHTSKLMEWLISRRHVPKDWSKRVVTIREKINEAIKDMPETKEVAELLTGSYIHYYHCKKIIDILKETEVNSKNLFGQYTSKRMKDWVEIVKLYEKDNVYLGEVASLLQRNVNYEVPALKKQIAKTITLKNEFDKKETNYEKMAEVALKDYHSSCKSFGIKGIKIRKELVEKAGEFPEMCREIANEIKTLKLPCGYYLNVVKALLNPKKLPLEILQYVIENGDVTIYQWKYKKVPDTIEHIHLTVEDDKEENVKEDVIDFGTDLETNFDEDIDWGISTVESDEIENEIKICEKEETKNVAKGDEAYTILSHMETRNLVLNDVLELEAFLRVRMHEMESEADGLGLTILSETLQMYDMQTVNEMLQSVQNVKQSLTNPTSLHYLNILTNEKYVGQLADKLKQKLSAHEKILASKDCIKIQRAEAIKEGESIKPKIDLLIKKSKELQLLIEEDISKRYKGRPVNLIAGANML